MKFIAYLIGYCVWLFSFLCLRSKKIWVFGSFRGTFSDNAKYLFIYLSSSQKKIFPVWITYKSSTVRKIREKGLKAYSIFSLKGLYYALRGGYYFFNSYTSDICFFTSGKAVGVNLWHGVGLKKIEFSIDKGLLYNRYVKKTFKERFYYPQVFKRPDYFISSTDFQTVKFASAFRISPEKCLNLGYPRNDILLMPEQKRQAFIAEYEPETVYLLIQKLKSYRKVYLYMPTWRESQRKLFTSYLDLKSLNEQMEKIDGLLLLKPHTNTIVENKEELTTYSRIVLLDGGVDIYPILPYTNVLITDYSSVLYDYLLMDGKAVILYLYDYRQYINDRDFNYPFLENVAGEIAYTFEQLIEIINKDIYNTAQYSLIRKRFWGTYQGDATSRIRDYFFKMI